jgi:hypothetical protein
MKTLKTMNTNQKNNSTLVSKTLKVLTVFVFALFTLTSCDPEDVNADDPETPSIDLKADAINFSVNPITPFAGDATITGSILNIGDDFRSGAGQQIIRLYERSLGTPTDQPGQEVARLEFSALDAGETLEVSFTRPWDSSSPAEGEFAPEYILVIDYDPDLQIDGNVHNNDNNSANNRILVNGHIINSMF